MDFLEIAIHTVLRGRKLYPEEVFERKDIYGSTVYICEHPELKKYINIALKTLKLLIDKSKNIFKSLNLLLFDTNKIVIEKYAFSFDKIIDIETLRLENLHN